MWKRWEINEAYKKRIIQTAEFIDDLHERGTNLSEPPTAEQLSVLFRSNVCWMIVGILVHLMQAEDVII